MIAARLSRELRLTGEKPRGAAASFEGHVVLLAVVGRDGLDGDLSAGRGAQPLEGVALLGLEVVSHVGMDADLGLVTRALDGRGLELPEDLRGDGGGGLHGAAALAGR